MRGSGFIRRAIGLLPVLIALAGSLGATWPPEKFNNLKVLPDDIPTQALIDRMAGFTRALGVRCTHCHVGEEGRPLSTYDFESDDKGTKRKAREMMRMVNDLNDRFLPSLESRADPPVGVQCATCHRGAAKPRMLQDVLMHAYETAGIDSTLAAYHALRERYHGGFTFDFSEVPLSDVATMLFDGGHVDAAVRLHALNVEVNPDSRLARRQHGSAAVLQAFLAEGAEGGTATWRRLREAYGEAAFPEPTLNRIGYRLLGQQRFDDAIAAFRLNAEAYPQSANAFDSLGEAYVKHGDRDLAIRSYRKSLELDPGSENAKKQLEALGAKAGR
jgi:hypothetical protein